jgi:glycosyltransferase involved in cell wall biosynthesis
LRKFQTNRNAARGIGYASEAAMFAPAAFRFCLLGAALLAAPVLSARDSAKAGVAVLHSAEWNAGDTVRDGVDGFRIATWAPEPGMGTPLARGHESGVLNYDRYCGFASATTALDLAHLVDALSALIDNPGIRKAMGASGRQRARDLYDWPVIYRQYQTLWSELNARRRFLTRPLAGAPARLPGRPADRQPPGARLPGPRVA